MELIALLAFALVTGLAQVAGKLVEKGVIEPSLEPAADQLKAWVRRGLRNAEKDKALLGAVRAALQKAGAPADDAEGITRWLQQVGLDRLVAEKNAALRRQVAQAVLSCSDPQADPPEDLRMALGWPRSQKKSLSAFLAAMRAQLAGQDDWKAPIEYADRAAERGMLQGMLDRLAQFDRIFVQTVEGEALRVAVVQAGLAKQEAADIEARYRQDLVNELHWHDIRGIVQIKRAMRLPLADIYQELGLLRMDSEEERRQAQEQFLTLRERERVAEEERRLEQRVTDALACSARLVVLGEPGAGKTMSLRFVTLMLAHGFGAARLGLDMPYIPLMVRLADYARAMQANPSLSLCNYLLVGLTQEPF